MKPINNTLSSLLSGLLQYRQRYYWLLLIMAASISLSRAMVSITMGVLVANFVLSPGVKARLRKAVNFPGLMVFLSLFVVFAAGLLYSENIENGLHRLLRALPLLVIPIVVSGSQELSTRKFRRVLHIFVLGVIVNLSFAWTLYLQNQGQLHFNIRQISFFFSHIRLALMILFAIAISGYQVYLERGKYRLIWGAIFLFLFSSLFLLQSLTGLVIAFVLIIILGVGLSLRMKRQIPRFVALIASLTLLLIVASFFSHALMRFHTTHPVDLTKIDTLTVNGTPYIHDTANLIRENGYYVGLYVAPVELKKEWNKRSDLNYNGKDRAGQELSETLKRFLTARGFRKDSVGVASLTESDISLIESGVANPVFVEENFLYARIYQTLWELEVYRHTGYVQEHSVAQRIEYLLSGWYVVKNNLWLGVGTGDIMSAQKMAFKERGAQLAPEHQRKSHNQWITLTMAFGIVGLMIFIVGMAVPVVKNKTYRNFLFNIFMGIILLSFFSDDTLDTHMGMNFFCFFYALFVFSGVGRREMKLMDKDKLG